MEWCSIIQPLHDYVVKPVCSFAKKHIYYVVCKSKLIEDLTAEREKLKVKITEIDMRVTAAVGEGKDIVPQVNIWHQEAGTRIEEVNRYLEQEKLNSDSKCGFSRCFCSIRNRYRMGKETANMLNTLKEKLQEASEPCFIEVGISPPPSPPAPMALPPTAFTEGYGSRESLLEEIIEALKVKNMIGIYGMAGVGKTVLVERLAAEVESRNLFGVVGIAVVSRPPDPAAIRNIIADRILHKKLHDYNSEEGKKDKLHHDLKTLVHEPKKVLLVLDDVWELLDLHEVGIPKPEEGFKIVLTSRFQDVCVQMEAEETFEVRVLNKQEAWSLFCRSLGRFAERLDSDAGYKDIAVEMVEHFGGLPLALVTLARALIGQELPAWKNAAYYLRERCLHEIDGMSEKVIGVVEISLSYLHRRDARAVFFFCCLFPEDYNIEPEVLMIYGIGWGLFDNRTLVEAMDAIVTLIDKLKSRSLLLEGQSEGTVKMHDVIRQTAIHIASKGEFDFLVKEYRGGRINVVPNDVMLGEKHAISIASDTSIMEFFRHKDVMKYPNLRILRLHGTRGLSDSDRLPHEFSTCFFEDMGNLKLLEMLKLAISSFPTSLGSLKSNLRALRLYNCMVDDITEVGELTNLEILDLRCSTIHVGLYGAVQRLIGLRMLDLTLCHVNDRFDNVVRGLPQLERLYMLEVKFFDCGKPITTSPVGLETLTQLEVLDLRVGRLEELTDNFLSTLGNLFSFRICVSDNPVHSIFELDNRVFSQYKILVFKDITMNEYHQQRLGQLLRVVDLLFLDGCDGFAQIMIYYGDELLSNLAWLNLDHCHDVEFVISGPTLMKTNDQLTPFAKLESLTLEHLEGLKAICAPSQHVVDLPKFKNVEIDLCNILPYVFTKSVARQLPKLERICIEHCSGIEEILATDNNNNNRSGNLSSSEIMDDANSLVLPSLQCLDFSSVPKLKHFAATNRSHGPPSAFFGEQVQLPELRELSMNSLPLCGKIWESQIPKGSFCQLGRLDIGDCGELRYIFSAAVARGLLQLKTLRIIHHCYNLEEVLKIENGNDDEQEKEESKVTFPRLHTIELCYLESLHSFCSARSSVLEFPSLESVEVSSDNMQRFSYASLDTPKLNHVSSRDGGKIWKGDLNTTVIHLYEERKVWSDICYWILGSIFKCLLLILGITLMSGIKIIIYLL